MLLRFSISIFLSISKTLYLFIENKRFSLYNFFIYFKTKFILFLLLVENINNSLEISFLGVSGFNELLKFEMGHIYLIYY